MKKGYWTPQNPRVRRQAGKTTQMQIQAVPEGKKEDDYQGSSSTSEGRVIKPERAENHRELFPGF